MGTTLQLSSHVRGVLLPPAFSLKSLKHSLLYQVWNKNNRGLPTVSVRGLTPQSVSHSGSFLDPSPFHLQSQYSCQINIDSAGHSWSLPPRSGPRWGQTRSSRPPSPPGSWSRRTAPGRRCPWSARWRRAPRWWRHGPTSRRSASRTHPPASLLPGGSPSRWNEMWLSFAVWELGSREIIGVKYSLRTTVGVLRS